MIHVCYGIYDKDGHYSKFCGTSITSIFENTQERVTVHILHDNTLTSDNREKFIYLAGRYGQQIKFYDIMKIGESKIEELKNVFTSISNSPFSIGTMYRFLIPEIIPLDIEKIIYLDAGDTLIHCNIKDLWNIDLKNYPCAAVPEVYNGATPKKFLPIIQKGIIQEENYFNAGIIFFNLNYLRNNNFFQIKDFANFPSEYKEYMILYDQDIFNYHFSTKYLKLPQNFNAFVRWDRAQKKNIERKIYHYTGRENLCRMEFDTKEPYNRLYLEYFIKTPWFDIEAIGNAAQSIRNFYNERQNFSLHMLNLITKRRRAFFARKNDFEVLKKIFEISNNEEVVKFDEPSPQCILNLMNVMSKSRGKKVYFIFFVNYEYVHDILTQNGFTEYLDFVDGMKFLSEQQGVSFNTHFILKDM